MKCPPTFLANARNKIWEAGLLLVLPLVFHRGFAEQFSTPKFFLTKSLIISGLALWAVGSVPRPTACRRRFSLGLPLLAFSFAALVSCFSSPVPRFSLLEVEFALCGPAWFLLVVSWGQSESSVTSMGVLTGVAGALVAGIAFLQRCGFDPLALGGYRVDWGTMVARMRLYSTFGNPNFVGGYLIGGVFPALALGVVSKARWARGLWLSFAGVMVAAILETGSRGAWLGLAAGLLMAGVIMLRTRKAEGNEIQHPAPCAGREMLGGAAPLGSPPAVLLTITLAERLTSQLSGRIYLWWFSWPILRDHPILGSGWGTYQLLYLQYQGKFLAAHPEYLGYWTNNRLLHNDPLQMLLETGLVGVTAFVWILWEYGRGGRRVLRQTVPRSIRCWIAASVGGVTAILADSLFNYQFAVPPTYILLFTLLAFPTLLQGAGVDETREGHPPTRHYESSPLPWGEGYGLCCPHRNFWSRIARLVSSLVIFAVAGGLLWQQARVLTSERAYQTAWDLEDRDDLAGAEESYRRSIGLNPLNGRAHFGLSRVLFITQRPPQALDEIVVAEQTYTDSHQEVLRARILDQMGRSTAALAAYRHALWLDPTLASVQADIERLSKAR